MLEEFRQHWLVRLGATSTSTGLLDTKPVPVVGYRRSKKHSDFLGSADYGYYASKKMYYFGYKLVATCTLAGLPLLYDLVPANIDGRRAVETLLEKLTGFRLLAKTELGLCARIVAKMASHLLRYILRCDFGIDVLTFSKVQAQFTSDVINCIQIVYLLSWVYE